MSLPVGLTGHGLVMWVIFERPLDFPDHFVMRAQETGHALGYAGVGRARIACVADTLDELRATPRALGLYCMPRYPDDVRSLVETWL